MQDLSNLILAIASLIGAITTCYQVIAKNKYSTPPDNMSVEDIKKEIKVLQNKLKESKKK